MARAYAREARKVTPEDDAQLLAADAAAAVNEFLDTLAREFHLAGGGGR
jgi:hypothetical protein